MDNIHHDILFICCMVYTFAFAFHLYYYYYYYLPHLRGVLEHYWESMCIAGIQNASVRASIRNNSAHTTHATHTTMKKI